MRVMIRGVLRIPVVPEFFLFRGIPHYAISVRISFMSTCRPFPISNLWLSNFVKGADHYSVRSDFTGFTDAALNDWKLTVITAISSALIPANINIEILTGVL